MHDGGVSIGSQRSIANRSSRQVVAAFSLTLLLLAAARALASLDFCRNTKAQGRSVSSL
jgi:hypothetical protein